MKTKIPEMTHYENESKRKKNEWTFKRTIKTAFLNERIFKSWLKMALTIKA